MSSAEHYVQAEGESEVKFEDAQHRLTLTFSLHLVQASQELYAVSSHGTLGIVRMIGDLGSSLLEGLIELLLTSATVLVSLLWLAVTKP